MSYCASRFHTTRRPTHEVLIGGIGVGATNPVRIQSMTTSDTQDIAATLRQCIALAEVGCEIVRITAPNVAAAKCLKTIRREFTAAGFGPIPLVSDIHFLPSAAMEAVEHVEKIRVNPGNYADKKKFAVLEYSDAEYERELQRLHESFSPLVKRARKLGRSLRVGTNHGSLSDRIMNRYGDTPLGMVESALEFLHIAESHGFKQTILSMKASNPKIMIQAYRLLVERMAAQNMHYPLHLGVTEAGDGEDGRIKSAIGIGSLLYDGLGDTIRVSLTEDSVYEIPVARSIADKAMSLWTGKDEPPGRSSDSARPLVAPYPDATAAATDSIDPYHFNRRETNSLTLGDKVTIGPDQPPTVVVRIPSIESIPTAREQFATAQLSDTPVEGLMVPITRVVELEKLVPIDGTFYVLALDPTLKVDDLRAHVDRLPSGTVLLRSFSTDDADTLTYFTRFAREHQMKLAVQIQPADLAVLSGKLRELGDKGLIFTLPAKPADCGHALGGYRKLVEALQQIGFRSPLWIRNTVGTAVQPKADFLSRLLDAAILTGGLLCDGLGDMVSIETESDAVRALKLTYNVLQGAGARSSKTEFVACPSCGRTLFDLQSTTQRIREKTGHLKGVKLAIMGCIVNGPGEMADADFGYVGGAPGKINLYVGKECVQYNIPQIDADDRLIALIKQYDKWVDPLPA